MVFLKEELPWLLLLRGRFGGQEIKKIFSLLIWRRGGDGCPQEDHAVRMATF